MKIRFNAVLLGSFIVGALALAVAAFLALGSSNLFRPTGHFIFYLSNSAAGLAEGTAVNLEGIRIGQVNTIKVLYDRHTKKSIVGVVCRVSRNLLTDLEGRKIPLTHPDVIRQLVNEGLYAQVQSAGVVGAKFVELGFNPPSPAFTPSGLPRSRYPVVPSLPSTMTRLTDNITGIVSKLRKTDFEGAVKQLQQVLASVNRQVGELETNRLTSHLSSAAASIDRFMTSADLHRAVARIQATAGDLQTLVTNLNSQVQPLATNLNATVVSAGETAQNLRDLLALRNQLGQQTQDLLKQFDRTARTVEQLADFLERHPNALITGRARAQTPDSP